MSHEPISVTVVDDEPHNLELYRRALAPQLVRLFSDPWIALQDLLTDPPTCLVIDYKMPDLDGLDFVRKCRIAGYEGAVLVVTAYPSAELLKTAEQLGLVYRVLAKPVSVDQLRDHVQVVADESRFMQNLAGGRRHRRFTIKIPVRVRIGDSAHELVADDVSLGGVALAWTPPPSTPEQVKIEVDVRGAIFELEGRLISRGGGRTGIEFIAPAPEFVWLLGTAIVNARYPITPTAAVV
jgi:two-component system, LuxR family, response regulator FixJ